MKRAAVQFGVLFRDVYGNDKIEELEEDGEDPYSYTAEVVMERLKTNVYNFTSRWPAGQELDKETVLKLCNVRYAMSANAYTRYQSYRN